VFYVVLVAGIISMLKIVYSVKGYISICQSIAYIYPAWYITSYCCWSSSDSWCNNKEL